MCHDPGIRHGLEPPEEEGLCSCSACLTALQEARQASTCFSDAIRALQVPPLSGFICAEAKEPNPLLHQELICPS